VSLALVDGWQRGVADRLTTDTEYLHDVPRVSDVGAMLRIFAEWIPGLQPESWTTHVAGHPPVRCWSSSAWIGSGCPGERRRRCCAGRVDAGIAVAVTLRALGAEAAARAALPFGVLFPGAVWIGVSADGLFAGVLAWGVALLALGAARPRFDVAAVVAAATGGLVLGASLYLDQDPHAHTLLHVLVISRTDRSASGTEVVVEVVLGYLEVRDKLEDLRDTP
jgi:hypothetical protein